MLFIPLMIGIKDVSTQMFLKTLQESKGQDKVHGRQ